jgi:hypothetical protein
LAVLKHFFARFRNSSGKRSLPIKPVAVVVGYSSRSYLSNALVDPWRKAQRELGHRTGEPAFKLNWTESRGPAVLYPTRRRFGLQVLERIAQEIDAKVIVTFAPRGIALFDQNTLYRKNSVFSPSFYPEGVAFEYQVLE